MNKVNTSNKFKGMKCINCGSTKHIFNDCPKAKSQGAKHLALDEELQIPLKHGQGRVHSFNDDKSCCDSSSDTFDVCKRFNHNHNTKAIRKDSDSYRLKDTRKITDVASHIICCQGCFELGRKNKAKEILDFINKERDEGNVFDDFNIEGNHKGFSASLCLSKIIKMLEDSNNE